MLASLPRRSRHKVQDKKIHRLGITSSPELVEKTLKLGPKFDTHPNFDIRELLSLVRTTVSNANAEDQERCILEGVGVLTPSEIRVCTLARNVVSERRESNTKLLLTDKEEGAGGG